MILDGFVGDSRTSSGKTLREDDNYRIVFRLPAYGAEEVSKNVWTKPTSMGALVSGQLEVSVGKRKYEIQVVPLSLTMGNGILNPHDGPLVRPKS